VVKKRGKGRRTWKKSAFAMIREKEREGKEMGGPRG